MTTFTDDSTGKKYELQHKVTSDRLLIRPIEAAKADKTALRFEVVHDDGNDFHDVATELLNMDAIYVTRSQAEALATAIKALVEYVQTPGGLHPGWHLVGIEADKARKAFQGDA